jgi:hypothetical protein
MMKKTFFMIVFLGFIYQIAKPAGAADNGAILGQWKCSVTDVPSEYSNSTITFTEKEGTLNGTVKFDYGQEVKLNTVKYTDNQLVLTLYIDGNEIRVDGKVALTKITGTVDTPDGKVIFTATRVVEKKK